MPGNQADAPLLLVSFPKRPRMRSEASRFSGSYKYKQIKTNKLPSFIDRCDNFEAKIHATLLYIRRIAIKHYSTHDDAKLKC
jgi:hypothetical protein